MTVPYCFQLHDSAGCVWLPDIETGLECSVSEAPDFEVSVDAVWADLHPHGRVDLIGRDATTEMRLIGFQIVEEAEQSEEVIAQVYAEEGISYRGLGGNDPDGRLVGAA